MLNGEGQLLFLTVEKEHEGTRLDVALCSLLDISRSAAARLIDEGHVTVSGKCVPKKTALRMGDEICARLPEPEECEARPENIPLDVVYEDGDIIVVNKPSGMVVHPAPGHADGTLVSALLYRCGDSLSGIGGVMRPGIVHRIDRFTSGLIAVAKNDRAHEGLSAQLADHSMHRIYTAIVVGCPKEETGTVDAPIARSLRDRKKMGIIPGGKEARTHWEIAERFSGYTLLRLRLETGRTHQIRVHMAHIGHPVLGDEVYGGDGCAFARHHPRLMDGQMLHAGELELVHPCTGERMGFSAPMPENMAKAVLILREESHVV